jgi:hypothetical protein
LKVVRLVLLFGGAQLYLCDVCYSRQLNNTLVRVTHKDILVRVGTSVRDNGGCLHEVSQIISHPDFDTESFDSDIALLKV